MPERTGLVTKAGHICMICGFLPETKNKYRELQDHLIRKHFQNRIKELLPTKRPYRCPSCHITGKDWQALMRHYTGKHGVLGEYLKEIIDSGLVLPQNPKLAKKKQKEQERRMQKRRRKMDDNCKKEQVSPPTLTNENTQVTSPEISEEELSQHNNNCSSSMYDQTQQSQPQLALVIKRAKPNGEESYALVDLKSFLSSNNFPGGNQIQVYSEEDCQNSGALLVQHPQSVAPDQQQYYQVKADQFVYSDNMMQHNTEMNHVSADAAISQISADAAMAIAHSQQSEVLVSSHDTSSNVTHEAVVQQEQQVLIPNCGQTVLHGEPVPVQDQHGNIVHIYFTPNGEAFQLPSHEQTGMEYVCSEMVADEKVIVQETYPVQIDQDDTSAQMVTTSSLATTVTTTSTSTRASASESEPVLTTLSLAQTSVLMPINAASVQTSASMPNNVAPVQTSAPVMLSAPNANLLEVKGEIAFSMF